MAFLTYFQIFGKNLKSNLYQTPCASICGSRCVRDIVSSWEMCFHLLWNEQRATFFWSAMAKLYISKVAVTKCWCFQQVWTFNWRSHAGIPAASFPVLQRAGGLLAAGSEIVQINPWQCRKLGLSVFPPAHRREDGRKLGELFFSDFGDFSTIFRRRRFFSEELCVDASSHIF